MKLPKSISPCPIRDAVCAVQFESQIPADAVFGIVYQSLREDFPQAGPLPILTLPPEVRAASRELTFQPCYRLSNATFNVLVGPQFISVGMRGGYPGWSTLSKSVKDILHRFHETGVVSRTLRLGLRYISFFDFDIFPHLQLRITVEGASWDGEGTFFKTILSGSGCKSLLQVGKGLQLIKQPDEQGSPQESGSVIDIDSFSTETAGSFTPLLDTFLENAHSSEKDLFFRLLKPEFLASLNPIYEDAN
jgi:uncharacterized protein (TIGR04255 family)